MSKDQSVIQDINQKGMDAVTALQKSMERFGADSVEFKQAIANTNSTIEKQELQNQELVKKQLETEKECTELKEKYTDMEGELLRLSKSNVAGQDWRESPEYKALTLFAKGGENVLNSIENAETKSLLRTDIDTDGGYLFQNEFASSVIEIVRDNSPVRAAATVMTVGKKTIELPKQSSFADAFYEGEAEAAQESTVKFAKETLTAYRLTTVMLATNDMVMDSNFDLFNIIRDAVGEAFAFKEGSLFVNGTGSKQPEGFLSNQTVIANATAAASAGVISADDLIGLTPKITKKANKPVYAFNRRTLAFLRLLKGTTNDHFIWQDGLAPDAPNTIGGVPYIILEDMPDYDGAVGAIPVVYADFKRGYRIIDRTGITMLEDRYTAGTQGIIKWIFSTYNTGQVVLPEAFAGLKIIS